MTRLRLTMCLSMLAVGSSARAQCGAQVSQCRSCHEVAGEHPVLVGGSPWHSDHAFGDFCVQCHRGDPNADTAAAAHVGITSPLADVDTLCGACHAGNATALADKYLRQPPPPPRSRAAAASGAADAVVWGNVALVGVIVLFGAGGCGYVVLNERRLRALTSAKGATP
jgi:hypothetical protein